jgi:hypothetical protein
VPRSTKASAALAHELGYTPSRVQGWFEGGFHPAHDVSHKERLAHFQALDPLTGTGRNADVATIKMAALGFQCARLRETLLGLQDFDPSHAISDAEELVEAADAMPKAALQRSAERLGVPEGFHDEPGLASARAGAAIWPLAMVAVGEPVEPHDFAELDELMNEPIARLSEVDASEVPTDLEGAAALSRRIADVVIGAAQRWFKEASDDELMKGVKAARRGVDALKILGVEFGGDEEEWLWVGRMAPISERMVASLARIYEAFYIPLAAGKDIALGERALVETLIGKPIPSEPIDSRPQLEEPGG